MVWLHEMKWPDVKEYLEESDLILLPIGSTEQHGRHAPLGTDAFIAAHIADDAAQRTSTVCAPPLYFGWSPHHLVLPGTISIDADVLQRFLFCEVRSLARHGFRNFVIINGHRITNLPWMQIGADEAQSQLGVRVFIFDPAHMQKELVRELDIGYIGHSSKFETSEMMHILPDMIDLSLAIDSPEAEQPSFTETDPAYPGDALCYVPNTLARMERIAEETGGSVGQPSSSTRALGERIHDHLVRRLVDVIEWIRTGSIA